MNGFEACKRAVKAHERRFGKSMLRISATVCSSLVPRLAEAAPDSYPRQWVRSVDYVSGSVVDWNFSGRRLRRIAERNNA